MFACRNRSIEGGSCCGMNNKDLKKLSRRELVEIIYQMKKNEQKMQERMDELQAALDDKRIRVSEAGSIAAVAASINGLMAAAQATADLYLSEIAYRKAEAERECATLIEDAKQTAARIRSEGSETT